MAEQIKSWSNQCCKEENFYHPLSVKHCKAPRGTPRTSKVLKTRAILTVDQAVRIYRIKLDSNQRYKSKGALAAAVANSFGVSEKAVRDIWSGRTWLRETKLVDAESDFTGPLISRSEIQEASTRDGLCASSVACLNIVHLGTSEFFHAPALAEPPSGPLEPANVPSSQDHLVASATTSLEHIMPAAHPQCPQTSGPDRKAPSPFVIPPQAPGAEFPAPPSPRARPWPCAARPCGRDSPAPPSRPDDPFHDDWPHWDRAAD